MRPHRFFAAVVGAGLLAGCTSSADLATDLGDLSSAYLIIDLSTGSRSTANTVSDLSTNAAYRDNLLVFRRVTDGANQSWLGVFEVTQAQWSRLANGATPWTTVPSAQVGTSAISATMPAFNLSYEDITAGLALWNAGRTLQFAVPTDAEWSAAAGSATWAWGASGDRATVEANAAVFETQDGTVGPHAVGERAANARGFYDLAGNVWEWTSPGTYIHGGSWHDPLSAAMSANHVGVIDGGIMSATEHALIGVRLAVRLP